MCFNFTDLTIQKILDVMDGLYEVNQFSNVWFNIIKQEC